MSALMQACARDIVSPVISEDDIMQGCSMQMRGYLQMKATDFVGSIIPKKGLTDIILEASARARAQAPASMDLYKRVFCCLFCDRCAEILRGNNAKCRSA
jgi:hypothetical protein